MAYSNAITIGPVFPFVAITLASFMLPAAVGAYRFQSGTRDASARRMMLFSTLVYLLSLPHDGVPTNEPLWPMWGWFLLPCIATLGAFMLDAAIQSVSLMRHPSLSPDDDEHE